MSAHDSRSGRPGPTRHRRPLGALVGLALAATGCGDNQTVPYHDAYASPQPEPLPCLPNLDGRIDAQEILPAFDTPISYLVSPSGVERPVDVAGFVNGDGLLVWDWSIDYADDQVARVVPRRLADQWFAGSFPAGEIVTPFDAGGRTLSISRQDTEAPWLLGLASAEPDPPEGRTLVVYGEPIPVVSFPIAPGASYVATGTVVDGMIRGLQYAGQDIYEVEMDAIGVALLPQITFTEAHRVRTRVTVQPAVGAATSRRQVSLFFECFAEVARAVSRADETEPNFTTASEVWRLGFE